VPALPRRFSAGIAKVAHAPIRLLLILANPRNRRGRNVRFRRVEIIRRWGRHPCPRLIDDNCSDPFLSSAYPVCLGHVEAQEMGPPWTWGRERNCGFVFAFLHIHGRPGIRECHIPCLVDRPVIGCSDGLPRNRASSVCMIAWQVTCAANSLPPCSLGLHAQQRMRWATTRAMKPKCAQRPAPSAKPNCSVSREAVRHLLPRFAPGGSLKIWWPRIARHR
jgi:hypothetical protein